MVYNDLIIKKNIQDNITNNISICKTMDIKTIITYNTFIYMQLYLNAQKSLKKSLFFSF